MTDDVDEPEASTPKTTLVVAVIVVALAAGSLLVAARTNEPPAAPAPTPRRETRVPAPPRPRPAAAPTPRREPSEAETAAEAIDARRQAQQRMASERLQHVRAELVALRRELSAGCETAARFVELSRTLERLDHEREGQFEDDLAQARAAERTARMIATMKAMDEARAWAARREYGNARASMTLAESLGLEVTPALRAERDRWQVEELRAAPDDGGGE